jgi:hypothetical protein
MSGRPLVKQPFWSTIHYQTDDRTNLDRTDVRRVLCGGSWSDVVGLVQLPGHDGITPVIRVDNLGFRYTVAKFPLRSNP